MPQVCQICNNPNRLAIDREIVAGKSKSAIALKFGVAAHSVSYHAENHLSRQLTQAWSRKSGVEAMGLMADIESLVGKARMIFDRNFEKNTASGDQTALKALDSERGTFELLVKIAALYHETKLLELRNDQQQFEEERTAETQEMLARLTDGEIELLYYLEMRMSGQEIPEHMVPEVFKEPVKETMPLPRKPLPAPEKPIVDEPASVNVSGDLQKESTPDTSGSTAGQDGLEAESKPIKRTLPPAPVKVLDDGKPSRRYGF